MVYVVPMGREMHERMWNSTGAGLCHWYLQINSPTLSAIGILVQRTQGVVEGILTEETLQTDVHAVAPIVTGIGRNVDALCISVGQTELLVDSKPILKGKDGE